MSMPNIPDIKPDISVSREDSINIVLSSIGMEEMSLAHILNAEAEKIQYALGTLEGSNKCPASFEHIMETNNASARVLRDVIKNQMLLSMKLEDIIEVIPTARPPQPEPPPCPPSPYPPCPPHPPCPPPYPPCPPPYSPCPPDTHCSHQSENQSNDVHCPYSNYSDCPYYQNR